MRPSSALAICLTAVAWAVVAPAWADSFTVEKAGWNLFRISGRDVFIRTDGCEDAPASGVVDVQKDGAARRLTFQGKATSCSVRDFLAPAQVTWDQYSVQLTQDQSRDWYRVGDSDLYLKTVGCVARATTNMALLDLKSDGRGWARFSDGRRCAIEHVFRRFNP